MSDTVRAVEKVLFNRKVHKVHLLRQLADSVDKNAKYAKSKTYGSVLCDLCANLCDLCG